MLGLKTLGKVFGTEKALSSVVSGVRDGLDALAYTDEEKAHDAAKDREAARGMVVDWMKATQGQNLARRLIALIVTVIWVVMYATTIVLGVASIWITGDDKIVAAAKIIGERATEMNGAMMLILGFYFAAPHLGDIVSTAMSRFGGGTGKAITSDLDRKG